MRFGSVTSSDLIPGPGMHSARRGACQRRGGDSRTTHRPGPRLRQPSLFLFLTEKSLARPLHSTIYDFVGDLLAVSRSFTPYLPQKGSFLSPNNRECSSDFSSHLHLSALKTSLWEWGLSSGFLTFWDVWNECCNSKRGPSVTALEGLRK